MSNTFPRGLRTIRRSSILNNPAQCPKFTCPHSFLLSSLIPLSSTAQTCHRNPVATRQQARPFSLSPRCRAMARAPHPNIKGNSMPSMVLTMKKQQQEAMTRGDIPNDLGLLPMTVVMPYGRTRPSLARNFAARFRLEKKRWKIRLGELLQSVYFHYWQVKPRPTIETNRIPALAAKLYEDIFISLARNDFHDVEKELCAGFLSSLRARAAQRPAGLKLHWTLHKHLSPPKLVSYKAAVLPGPADASKEEQSGIIQAIVRLHTRQSLRHLKQVHGRDGQGKLSVKAIQVDGRGNEIAGELPTKENAPEDAKDQVEYLVVQKLLKRGKFGDWMAWGLTVETPFEEIVRREDKLREMMAAARSNRAAATASSRA